MAFTCADLSVYYALEETSTSGARVDAKGTSDLSCINSGGGAAAIIGNGATFSGTHYLERASTAALTWNGNTNFSAACWLYLTSTAVQGLVWKGDAVSVLADYEWRLQTDGSNHFMFVVTDGVSQQGVLTSAGTWSTSTWVFCAVWYDGVNLSISLNDGTPTTLAYTYGSWAGGHHLTLGGVATGGSSGNLLASGSMMDEVSIWNQYAFTAGDITALYNGGAGLAYSSICAATAKPWLYYAQQRIGAS